MEQHEIFRICWNDATPDEPALNAAFRQAGALDPAITFEDAGDEQFVRVEFDYVSSGDVDAINVATSAADSLGRVKQLDRLTA
jgi:hypothetical protein